MSNYPLSTKNTIFFSTAEDSQIFQTATSLLSIRQFVPDANLYILSRQISNKNKKLLKRRQINYIELDLTYLFFQTWEHPIEYYYLFAGPEIFKKLGFNYSIYLNNDVLCLKNPLENCPHIHDIGGTTISNPKTIFPAEKNIFSKEFNIPKNSFSCRCIDSDIIYMNNTALSNLKLLDVCGNLYYRAWNIGLPTRSNKALFYLFQLVYSIKLSPTALKNLYTNTCTSAKPYLFFNFSLDKPYKFHPYKHFDATQNELNSHIKNWRNISRKNYPIEWFYTLSISTILRNKIKRIKKGIKQIPSVIKGVRYPIIKKRKNVTKPPIQLFWWEPPHIKNFGDVVSKDLIYNIFGRNVIWSPIETCKLIAAGSIIEVAQQAKRKDNFYAWGSGFIRSNSGNKNLDSIIFTAVRGEKTSSRIKKNVPLGDPGLLVGPAFSVKKARHSKKIGVVIHYADLKLPIVKKFCEDSRFEVITPLDLSENVARKIASCKLILSSSLHGLIFADSLSIPNIHIKLSNNLTGGNYKFIDYYSGINKKYLTADIKKIFDNKYLTQLKSDYKPINKLTKRQRALIKAFPFD